jgi:multidrug resistance protein, MATE family
MFKSVSTSYKKILAISFPLIIGSLGYNIVAATDTLFIGRSGDTISLAAIGLVAPFYLMITLIGLSFSRGGQILIARRVGAKNWQAVGAITQNMLYFQLILAAGFYVILKFFGYEVLDIFVQNEEILKSCEGYLYYRVDGILFGYAGLTAIALYSGLGRTNVIIYNTIILAVVNVFLDYVLVFGYWGFPEMGIEGAGMASAISEVVAFITFVAYAFWDKFSKRYQLFKLPPIDWDSIKTQLKLSTPIALQSGVGLFSWFLFFSLIEKLGTESLAISSTVRVIYIFFSVSAWGLGSATSTIVSQLIGQEKQDEVFWTTTKIMWVSIIITAIPSLLLLVAPEYVMLVVTDNQEIIQASIPLLKMLFFIEIGIAAYTIYYNGIVGTGAISIGLIINIITSLIYVAYIYYMVIYTNDLLWVWSAEFVFSTTVLILSMVYLKSNRWQRVEF